MSSSNGFNLNSLFALEHSLLSHVRSTETEQLGEEAELAASELEAAADQVETPSLDELPDLQDNQNDEEMPDNQVPIPKIEADAVPEDPLSHSNSLFALEQSVLRVSASPAHTMQFVLKDDEPKAQPIVSQAYDWNEAIALEYDASVYSSAKPNTERNLESNAESMAESFDWLPTEDHDYGFGLGDEPLTYEVEAFEVVDTPALIENKSEINPAEVVSSLDQPTPAHSAPEQPTSTQPALEQPASEHESPKFTDSSKSNESPQLTEPPKLEQSPEPAESPASAESPQPAATPAVVKSNELQTNYPEQPSQAEAPAPTPATVNQIPAHASDSVQPQDQPTASDAIPVQAVQAVVVNPPQSPSKSAQPEALEVDFDEFERTPLPDRSSDAEAFAADIAAILRGEKVYEPAAESPLEPPPQPALPQPVPQPAPSPAPSQAQSPPPKQPNGHDIFDQMQMSYATAFDLGTFSLQQTFDAFDAELYGAESDALGYENEAFGYEDEADDEPEAIHASVLELSSPPKQPPKQLSEQPYQPDRTLEEEQNIGSNERLSVATGWIDKIRGYFMGFQPLKDKAILAKIPAPEGKYFELKAEYFEALEPKESKLISELKQSQFLTNKPSTQDDCIGEVSGFSKTIHEYLLTASDTVLTPDKIDPVLALLGKLNQLREGLINAGFLPSEEKREEKRRKELIDAINRLGGALKETIGLALFRRDHIIVGRKLLKTKEVGEELPEEERKQILESISLFDQKGNKFSTEDIKPEEAITHLRNSLEVLEENGLLRGIERPLEKLKALEKIQNKGEEITGYLQTAFNFAKELQEKRDIELTVAGGITARKNFKAEAVSKLKLESDIHSGLMAFAELQTRLEAGLKVDVHAEFAYKALLLSFKANAEAWAGIAKELKADIRISMQEISAELGWNIEAAIRLKAHAEAYLKFGPLEIEAELDTNTFVGVRCAGDFTLKINTDGVKCGFQLDAFAGTEFGFKSSLGIKIGEKTFQELGFEARFLSGVGYTFKGEFNIEAGKIKIRLNAGAALGLGLGLGLEFTIDPKALALAIGKYVSTAYLNAASTLKARWRGYKELLDFEDEISAFNQTITEFEQQKSKMIKEKGTSEFIGGKGRVKRLELYLEHAKLIDGKSSSGRRGGEEKDTKQDLKDILWQVFIERFGNDDLFAELKNSVSELNIQEYLQSLNERKLIPEGTLEDFRRRKLIGSA